jgi:nucleotide-binding universal stress UspA family protein
VRRLSAYRVRTHKLLVAYDDSEAAKAAVRWAIDEAMVTGSTVLLA